MAPPTPLPAPRIVIASHKNDGASVFTEDKVNTPFQPFGPGSTIFNSFHSSPSVPVSNTASLSDLSTSIPKCPPNGVLFCTTDFAPRSPAPMHRTATVDYIFVLSGEVVAKLDGGEEKVIRAGDCMVQRGTNHLWENRTDEWCRVAVVMVSSQVIELTDGTRLEATQFGKKK